MTDEIAAEIKEGESSSREFKSSLRWNLKAKKNDDAITLSVLRTIAGFLNTSGGVLFIGVDDYGNVTGIGSDNYKTDDQFVVALFNFIRTALGSEVAALVDAKVILAVNGEKLCRVQCKPSGNPAFLSYGAEKDAFFVRSGPATTKLPGSKVHLYIREHWTEKGAAPRPRITLQYVSPTDTKYGYFVFRNVEDAAAHNILAEVEVSDTKWTIQFGPTEVLERAASVEVALSTFYEGRSILKPKFEGDFRLLMKGIYVRRAEEIGKTGGETETMRAYLRQPHSSDFQVVYCDFDGRSYNTPHRLTYDPSKHSVVIQILN